MTRRIMVATLLLALGLVASPAANLRDGLVALGRHDDGGAARTLVPLAERGDARAQTLLGYMFANGRGVPQNYVVAAYWYRRASEQGNATAQYSLGLMYDKGQGVPLDYVLAYKWLNLAVARVGGRERQDWVKIRDAVESKLSLLERTEGQRLAVEWQPTLRP
ncbi:MAG TPA: tetratricopeptide repeat protein [Xanthobacteraceae bacterium]|nr:tetratricopeptide repeat protein [Xanthobacteraceae bacterium]